MTDGWARRDDNMPWHRRPKSLGLAVVVALILSSIVATTAYARQTPSPPRILIDQSPRAVEYQLRRLTVAELAALERREDDVRYRLVYYALLTRQGLAVRYRDEALAALVKLDRISVPLVLLEALRMVPAEEAAASDRLTGMLLSQPVEVLRRERAAFSAATDGMGPPFVWQGAYGALLMTDGAIAPTWEVASARGGHLAALLRSVPAIPVGADADGLRRELAVAIARLLASGPAVELRRAAYAALGWTVPTAEVVRVLANGMAMDTDEAARTAAVQSLGRIPATAWPAGVLDQVVQAILAVVAAAPPERRVEAAFVDAIHLADTLAATLPDDRGRSVRRELGALGVRVVRLETVPEELRFNLKWFVVQAATRVQVVFSNPDSMPHNLVVGRPGTVEEIGMAGGAMAVPADPSVKPYVPSSLSVLSATKLLQQGETDRLTFVAPKVPGEYVFLCTFPGHWVRMYGVMLVVDDLAAFEANPTAPSDPVTKKPFVER